MKQLTPNDLDAAIASVIKPRDQFAYTEQEQGYLELGAWRFLEYLKANGLIAT